MQLEKKIQRRREDDTQRWKTKMDHFARDLKKKVAE